MQRAFRLLDCVYKKNDPRQSPGRIVFANEDSDKKFYFIVFFPQDSCQQLLAADELKFSNSFTDTLLSNVIVKQRSLIQQELTEEEISRILKSELNSAESRRYVWYDLILYKSDYFAKNIIHMDEVTVVHPIISTLLQYPIPEEIRCFVWSICLGLADNYQCGYYSMKKNQTFGIPRKILDTIDADLRRMAREDIDKDQVKRIALYHQNPVVGYIQGMNFIVYAFLHWFTEEETFFLFNAICNFLPDGYYNRELEGIQTENILLTALLKKQDSYLYCRIENPSEDTFYFFSVFFSWLAVLFTDPFASSFYCRALDFIFIMGNWMIPVVVMVVIQMMRKRLLICDDTPAIMECLQSIPAVMVEEIDTFSRLLYDVCVMTDINEILSLRKTYHSTVLNSHNASDDGGISDRENDEGAQDMNTSRLSTQSEETSELGRLSFHRRKRLSGELTKHTSRNSISSALSCSDDERKSSVDSFDLPSFGTIRISDDDDDDNPWQSSVFVVEDEETKEEKPCVTIPLEDISSDEEEEEEWVEMNGNKLKWNPAKTFIKKVFKVYEEFMASKNDNYIMQNDENTDNGILLLGKGISIMNGFLLKDH